MYVTPLPTQKKVVDAVEEPVVDDAAEAKAAKKAAKQKAKEEAAAAAAAANDDDDDDEDELKVCPLNITTNLSGRTTRCITSRLLSSGNIIFEVYGVNAPCSDFVCFRCLYTLRSTSKSQRRRRRMRH